MSQVGMKRTCLLTLPYVNTDKSACRHDEAKTSGQEMGRGELSAYEGRKVGSGGDLNSRPWGYESLPCIFVNSSCTNAGVLAGARFG
jgi:hypothetical protein